MQGKVQRERLRHGDLKNGPLFVVSSNEGGFFGGSLNSSEEGGFGMDEDQVERWLQPLGKQFCALRCCLFTVLLVWGWF